MPTATSTKRYVRALSAFAGFCAAFMAQAQAQAPEVVTNFASGAPSGRYAFASWTPKTLGELMQGNKGGETVNIVGHLFLPPGNDKVPAVVLVHGAGGIYKAELDFWPKQFNAAGIATLRASVEKIITAQKLPDGLRYAAFIPTYAGGCAEIFRLMVRPGVFSKAPLLLGRLPARNRHRDPVRV